MAISQFEMYHGAVLAQVARCPSVSLKLIERDEKHGWGAYSVAHNKGDYYLYIKYSTNITQGKKGKTYSSFSFAPKEAELLRTSNKQQLMCLVCGENEICLLNVTDIKYLGLLSIHKNQNIKVSWSEGTGLEVKSSGVVLNRKVPRNSLKKVFEK